MRASLLLLLLTTPLTAKEPAKADCKSFHIAISLKEGAAFEKELGEGFVFKITAEEQADGSPDWFMTLENAKRPGQDYMWPLNGPMHFNSSQYYGPVFGQTLQDSTRTRSLDFLLGHEDLDAITRLRSEAQWPAADFDDAKNFAEIQKALKRARTGTVRLVVKHHTINAKGQLDSIDLDAEFTVPADFKASETRTQSVPCVPIHMLREK